MKKILLATVAVLASAGIASAADLAARRGMPVKAPAIVAPVFSWTGCYIGGFAGGAFTNKDVTTTQAGATTASSFSYDLDSSFIGGGTVGCNWQPVGSPFVLGLEGEVGYMSLEGSATNPASQAYISSTKIGDWYGVVAGRLGYAVDRALIYVKGGVAFVDVENTALFTTTGAFASAKDTKATWAVGGGLEYALDPSWSVKAEYLYIGLDQTDSLLLGTNPRLDSQIDGIHTAKVGLNYRFGGGMPIVAKY